MKRAATFFYLYGHDAELPFISLLDHLFFPILLGVANKV